MADRAADSQQGFDVAISFAGEDRLHATQLAGALQARQVSVFLADWASSELIGEDLYTYLTDMYFKHARLALWLISEHYAAKTWTDLERKASQARTLTEDGAYRTMITITASSEAVAQSLLARYGRYAPAPKSVDT